MDEVLADPHAHQELAGLLAERRRPGGGEEILRVEGVIERSGCGTEGGRWIVPELVAASVAQLAGGVEAGRTAGGERDVHGVPADEVVHQGPHVPLRARSWRSPLLRTHAVEQVAHRVVHAAEIGDGCGGMIGHAVMVEDCRRRWALIEKEGAHHGRAGSPAERKRERSSERASYPTEVTDREDSAIVGASSEPPTEPARVVRVALRVNGQRREVEVDTRTSLLDLLRERLGLAGAKKGCDHGQCGACTVLLDGRRVNSCLTFAVACEGAEIRTIEGLADGDRLHPVQDAFIEHDGFQCGYCTPGQICSAVAMLEEVRAGWPSAVTQDLAAGPVALDEEEIAERMSGNLCRCGAYLGIRAAIKEAAR